MQELLRTNDPVFIGWAQSLLDEAGIDVLVFDEATAVAEGSIGAIQRRLMVHDDDLDRARAVLETAQADIASGDGDATPDDDTLGDDDG